MNTKSGCALLHGGDHGRPVVGFGPGPAALAPRALERVVHHQHRHVAAHAVALRGDRAQRLGHGCAQVGRERVQLHDVGPGGEVRVAAVREHAVADARRTTPDPARDPRRSRARSTRGAPPSTGGRARRGSARSREATRRRARRAPRARPRAPPVRRGGHRPCSRGCSKASRRHPSSAKSGRARRKLSTRPAFSSAIAIPAGLRSQTPISQTDVEAERRDRVPLGPGHGREVDRGALAAAQLVEPHPRVDLVDEGVLDRRLAPSRPAPSADTAMEHRAWWAGRSMS